MICLLFPIDASADTGPKPSIVIQFKNMGDELCYGTLLSKDKTTGPYSAWDGSEKDMPDAVYTDMDIWRAFVDYEDADGYYFLQKTFPCSEDKAIEWTYLPPSPFKILLYYPGTNTFISSGIYEKYAFDSYFSVDMNGINIAKVIEQEYEKQTKLGNWPDRRPPQSKAAEGTRHQLAEEADESLCPECGGALEHEGGCVICRMCGYSKCG